MGGMTSVPAILSILLIMTMAPVSARRAQAAPQPGDLVTIGAKDAPVVVYRTSRNSLAAGKINVGIKMETIRSHTPRDSEETWHQVLVDGWILESDLSWSGQVSQPGDEETTPEFVKRLEKSGKLSKNALWWLSEEFKRNEAIKEVRQNDQATGERTRDRRRRVNPADFFPTIRSKAAALRAQPGQSSKFLGQLYGGCNPMVIGQQKIGRESWCHILTSAWLSERDIKSDEVRDTTPATEQTTEAPLHPTGRRGSADQ